MRAEDEEELKVESTQAQSQYTNPFQQNTLWKSAKDPISKVASVKDFIRDQRIS